MHTNNLCAVSLERLCGKCSRMLWLGNYEVFPNFEGFVSISCVPVWCYCCTLFLFLNSIWAWLIILAMDWRPNLFFWFNPRVYLFYFLPSLLSCFGFFGGISAVCGEIRNFLNWFKPGLIFAVVIELFILVFCFGVRELILPLWIVWNGLFSNQVWFLNWMMIFISDV